MSGNPGRVGGTVVGIIALVAVIAIFLRPDAKPATDQPPARAGHVAGEQRFRGQGNRTLGQITVAAASEAVFDCPACDTTGFEITSTDPANPTNGLNDVTPGGATARFAVAAGTYSAVHVTTGGNAWTLTLTPNA